MSMTSIVSEVPVLRRERSSLSRCSFSWREDDMAAEGVATADAGDGLAKPARAWVLTGVRRGCGGQA